MVFKIVVEKRAEKDIDSLPGVVAKRILKKMLWILGQKEPLRYGKRLQEPASGDIRFRLGDYRVIAIIDSERQIMYLVQIGHRREIYRDSV